jgi:hypothetical protein
VFLTKHTLSKYGLGRLDLKPGPHPYFPFIIIYWAGSSPAMLAGLDPAGQPGHWPQPVTQLQDGARVKRAYTREGLIKTQNELSM